MKHIRLGLLLCILHYALCIPVASAQEIYCQVKVISGGAEVQNKQVFTEMQKAMQDFMNLRRRTTDQFSTEERILVNIVLSITASPRIGYYEATAQVQAVRPVYGVSLETPLLNFLDRDWQFEYTEGMPMDFNDNTLTYANSLTSLLSFYAYVILGLDYDSFGKLGGKNFYQKAQYITTNTAQSDAGRGWKAFDGTNTRYSLVDNLMDQRVAPFREGMYEYYRLGLDRFLEQPEEARKSVLSCLQKIQQVQLIKPLNIAINTFLDTKSNEIVNIYQTAQPAEKQAAYNILVAIDPTKTDRYKAMIGQ